MKKILISLASLMMLANTAFAEYREHKSYGRRYKARYEDFDNGFHRQYRYTEVRSSSCTNHTCLNRTFRSSDYVYIEEDVIYDRAYGEQRIVRVYENDRYDTYVTTYYVSNDGERSCVRARYYNENYYGYYTYYHYTPYIMPGLVLTEDMRRDFDDQSAALLTAGAIVFDFGLNVATVCNNSDCGEMAGEIMLAGLASSVFASISNEVKKEMNKTELEKQIEQASKHKADRIN